jgi:O-acetyl-ADP-ribose deacetylase (regulator of RNase III)
MPIRELAGDIFESGAQTLVNTVNTRGVMGKGIALAFKERYPEMFEDYRRRCGRGEVRVGEPYLYRPAAPGQPWVLNFPTKDHWRFPSRPEWIRSGLEHFAANHRAWGIRSIAFPRLGTQNGGLPWPQVRAIMLEILGPLDLDVSIYAHGTPEADGVALTFVNTATVQLLVQRCGLKAGLARKILDRRAALGGFERVEQLLDIDGLGPRTLLRITRAAAAPRLEQRQLL